MKPDQIEHLLLENMGTALLLLDKKLRLQYLNPAAEMLLEKSARRVQNKSIDIACPKQPEMLSFLQLAQNRQQPLIKHKIPLTLPSGHSFTATFSSTPVEINDSASLLIEITRIDSELNPEHDQKHRQQYSATRALIRGLAHEIKNPLGGLRGAAQLLESELNNPEQKEYTSIIMAEADRLHALIDRMLRPSQSPQKQAINIHEIIEHVRKLIQAEAGQGVSVRRDYDPSIPKLWLDRGQIIQVLLNIMGNAVEALAGAGEIILRTRILRQHIINGERYPLSACIEVIDSGPGIPENLQPQVFFPMISGKANGTGLGLSIAQSLVSQHNGVLNLYSRPGKTRFEILFPITQTP